MKAKLLIMGVSCAIAFNANAQTKGTNTLGFGLGFSKQESTYNGGSGASSESTSKYSFISIGYGHFFKDNEKISLDLSYGANNTESSPSNGQKMRDYGSSLSYQKYFPLLKKLYAHGGGKVAYIFTKQTNEPTNQSDFRSNNYNVGAYGGVSWFLSKRFALETNILSANLGYSKSKQTIDQSPSYIRETESSSFGISTQGVFNDLGFKIYLLF